MSSELSKLRDSIIEQIRKYSIYIITLIATTLIIGDYISIILVSLWWGNVGILSPIKIALVSGFVVAVGYPLYDLTHSAYKRIWSRGIVSAIALMTASSLILALHDALGKFILGTEFLIDLTTLSYEVRILTTSGLTLIIVFFAYSIRYFQELFTARRKLESAAQTFSKTIRSLDEAKIRADETKVLAQELQKMVTELIRSRP